MSTVPEPQEPKPPTDAISQLASLFAQSPRDPKNAQIAELQRQVQATQEKAAEERFLWVLAFLIVVDFAWFTAMQNWAAPVVIGVLELIGLLVWADRCGVNAVAPLIDRLLGMVGKKAGGD